MTTVIISIHTLKHAYMYTTTTLLSPPTNTKMPRFLYLIQMFCQGPRGEQHAIICMGVSAPTGLLILKEFCPREQTVTKMTSEGAVCLLPTDHQYQNMWKESGTLRQ